MTQKNILNETGQALAMALAATTITTASVLFMMTRIYNTEKELRAPRVKAQQTIQKVRINNALNLSLMYNCTATVAATQTCTLDVDGLRAILAPVKGAECDTPYNSVANELLPPTGCGFSLRPFVAGAPLLDYDARKFDATIHYMGKEVSLKDTRITFDIPSQLLIGEVTLCPANQPKFKGFDPSGNAICEAFSANMTCPNPGEFIESIDPVTFAVTCHSYTSGKTCGSDQFLSNLTYSNGTYTGSCVKRLNPFTYYDFNPEVSKSSTDFEPYVFRGGGLDGGSYGYYNVDYPVVPPSDRACDANTAPW